MRQSPWNYLLTVIVSAATGAAVAWLIISQTSIPNVFRPTPPAQAVIPTTATPGASASSSEAVNLGNIAYDHQQWSEAIRLYQEAIANGMDNPDVRTDLGNAFRFSGQPEQALSQYMLAQKSNPQHENSLFNQITLFTDVIKQPGSAIAICEEFIRRFPNSDKLPAVREQLERTKASQR